MLSVVHTRPLHILRVRRTLLLLYINPSKVKVRSQDTCYSAAYMSQTRDQQRLTISEVAPDWHEPMEPQRIMWPSIAVNLCSIDLSKAFDKVNHHGLLIKLMKRNLPVFSGDNRTLVKYLSFSC